MSAFWIALFIILIAEMGDKTQLVALAFATRYRPTLVMAGVLVATLIVHLFSVLVGEAAGRALPVFWVDTIGGLAFIGFGLWTLRGDTKVDSHIAQRSRFGPFITIFATFFLAELGDKTMLATVTIAGQQNRFFSVWIGSTIGMVLADGIAVAGGNLARHRLPATLIKYGAAVIFMGSGAFSLARAVLGRG
jgi:putative Ca2+/H+ antiporter (TMEM165/GDT1 family)